MQDDLRSLLTDAVSDADLPLAEIPSIQLYLDQIISLITDHNAKGSARYHDRVLTKTMINNYSKVGLIAPIKGKKYSREQIIQMLYIYALKSTLSIGEIRQLMLGATMPDGGLNGETLLCCYDRFLEIKQANRSESISTMERLMEANQLDPQKEQDYFLAILGAASLSAYFKAMAEAMLEAHYPDPDAKKADKPEKAEKAEKPSRDKADKKKAEKEAKIRKETSKTEGSQP